MTSTNYGQLAYAFREKYLAEARRQYNAKHRHKLTASVFKTTNPLGKKIQADFAKDGRMYNWLFSLPSEQLHHLQTQGIKDLYATHYPDDHTASGLSNTEPGDDDAGPSTAKQPRIADDPPSSLDVNTDSDSFRSASQENTDLDFTPSTRAGTSMSEPMDTQSSTTNVSSGGISGAGLGPHSTPSGSGPIYLGRSTINATQDVHFTKSRIMYSYSYAHTHLEKYWQRLLCTPFSYIPVDYLPFYLSPSEFDSLPEHAYIKYVTCKVRVLGSRTSFDTGTTLTGHANTEHIPICIWAEGLNLKTEGTNYCYTSNANAPMVPTGLDEQYPVHEMHKKWYEAEYPQVLGIPRSNSFYWVSTRMLPDKPSNPDWIPHWKAPLKTGEIRWDKFTNKALLNTIIGKTIINYSYQVPPNVLRWLKPLPSSMSAKDASYVFTGGWNRPTRLEVMQGEWHGSWKVNSIVNRHEIQNRYSHDYNRPLNDLCIYDVTKNDNFRPAQPQVHVGMLPIPTINPSVDNIEWQNSCILYEVDCSITLGINYDGHHTYGLPSAPHSSTMVDIGNTTTGPWHGCTLLRQSCTTVGVSSTSGNFECEYSGPQEPDHIGSCANGSTTVGTLLDAGPSPCMAVQRKGECTLEECFRVPGCHGKRSAKLTDRFPEEIRREFEILSTQDVKKGGKHVRFQK